MKIKRISRMSTRSIMERNFGLFKMLDEKEKLIKMNLQDYSNIFINSTIQFIR